MNSDNEKPARPFRDLGPREKADEQDAAEHSAPASKPASGIQQSIFQSPVDLEAPPPAIPEEVRVAAEERRREYEAACQRWLNKRIQHCIGSSAALGMAGLVFALPTALHSIFPSISCVLGIITGAIIGYHRIDDFWSRLIHTIPQIIWSIVALLLEWQATGYAFMISAGVWLMHFYIATLVAVKIQLDGKDV